MSDVKRYALVGGKMLAEPLGKEHDFATRYVCAGVYQAIEAKCAALEAECERLRELFKESERHLHHWQGQAAAKGRNVVSVEKERDTLRAELAALKAPAGDPNDYLMVKRELLAMVLNALDRDAAEGKQARGEMAAELRSGVKAPAVAGDERAMQLLADLSRTPQDGEKVSRQRLAAISEVGHDRAAFIARLTRPAQTEQQVQSENTRRTLRWVVDRWHAEVANRPLVNVYRRILDSTWRQMIRHLGEDDVVLLGPRHDDMLDASGNPLPLYVTAPIAQTPADQPSGCDWCAGARHDYYGEKCNHCQTPADGLVDALEQSGHDQLWQWFGLSYAAWLTLPRVLMHAMPDEWQRQMAVLLDEWDEAWSTGSLPAPEVTAKADGKYTAWPEWLLNYRRPDRAAIEAVRAALAAHRAGGAV